MPIYAISDLHLALGAEKPMDVFGGRWEGYMDKLARNWKDTVHDDDLVLIPGDVSWATYLEGSLPDFRFISSLPGRKVISKGNHDYWWATMSKLCRFLEHNGIRGVEFMHNSSMAFENSVICGTRGWKCPGDDDFGAEDMKIYLRELQRLELSLKSAVKRMNEDTPLLIAAIHFPPFNSQREPSEFVSVMKEYSVNLCIYGHMHGIGGKSAVEGLYDDITFRCVSADRLDFTPARLP